MITPLDSSELQIWKADLNVSESQVQEFAELLSGDERQRAGRFAFEKDRRSFTVSRGILRILVQGYLGISAREVEFRYSARGKPELSVDTDLRFNLSHSSGIVLVAFVRGCEVGVDVECVRPIDKMFSVARQFLSAAECDELMSLREDERVNAFYRCWTRKEAFVKATGDGLSHIHYESAEASQWSLQQVDLELPYVGAVAYRASAKKLRLFDISTGTFCKST